MLNLGARNRMETLLPEFQDELFQGGVQAAKELCEKRTGMVATHLYPAALDASPQGIAAMKRAMAHAIEFEILPKLNFLLAPILAIAKIATMVGLLLTVISMINTFNAISEATGKGGNPQSVTSQAGAIGLALFGTAGGLVIAIPLVFMHVLFKDRVVRTETELKSASVKLLLLFQNMKPGQGDSKSQQSAPSRNRQGAS
ncbi:MAG: MotA/TolQ/ExbB proton channel family protein [Zavarzinella sp.]